MSVYAQQDAWCLHSPEEGIVSLRTGVPMVVSSPKSDGHQPQVLGRVASVLTCWATSPAALHLTFKKYNKSHRMIPKRFLLRYRFRYQMDNNG